MGQYAPEFSPVQVVPNLPARPGNPILTATARADAEPGKAAADEHTADDPRVRRTRAAALATARQLLTEGGWDAVTHVAVSQRSGIGRTTLYRHWPTADLLLRELIMESCGGVAIERTGDLRTDLIRYVDFFRRRLLEPTVERAIATAIERATVNPVFSRVRAAITDQCTEQLAATISAAVEDGCLRSATDVGRAVDELAGPVAFRHLFERKAVTEEFVTQVVDDFLASHAAGRASAPAPEGDEK